MGGTQVFSFANGWHAACSRGQCSVDHGNIKSDRGDTDAQCVRPGQSRRYRPTLNFCFLILSLRQRLTTFHVANQQVMNKRSAAGARSSDTNDRTEPLVGASVVLSIYKDSLGTKRAATMKWVVELLYPTLLQWNQWAWTLRRCARLFVVVSNPIAIFEFESLPHMTLNGLGTTWARILHTVDFWCSEQTMTTYRVREGL